MARTCPYCRSTADRLAIKCDCCGAILPASAPDDDLATLDLRRRRAEAERAELEAQQLRDSSMRSQAETEWKRGRSVLETEGAIAWKSARAAKKLVRLFALGIVVSFVGTIAADFQRPNGPVQILFGTAFLILIPLTIFAVVISFIRSGRVGRARRKLNTYVRSGHK